MQDIECVAREEGKVGKVKVFVQKRKGWIGIAA